MSETPDIPASCAALAAELVVDGCLRIIDGTVRGKTPVAPATLQPAERAKLGLPAGGVTLFYPAGEEGVFLDLERSEFSVWFTGGDCEAATAALHQKLMHAYPGAKQLDDVGHPLDNRMRARAYRVELGAGRLGAISTAFSMVAGKHRFTARVIAQQRRS